MSDYLYRCPHLKTFHGKTAVRINGNDAYGRHATEADDECLFSFTFPKKAGIYSATIFLRRDGTDAEIPYPVRYVQSEKDAEIWDCSLPRGQEPGLYFVTLSVSTPFGVLYGKGGNRFSFSFEKVHLFQLTVSRFTHEPPEWLYGGVIYHIFVDRFFRGGNEEPLPGTILRKDWDNGIPEYPPYPGAPLKNNTFFGGDLWGIAQKLPYIASLGVKTIYLSPVFRSPSNHKYDTANYEEVDPMFGGKEALLSLIDAAKSYGIRLILDGVFNHTGADSLYFNRYGNYPSLGAYQSKNSPYYHWFTFRHFPDDYECWWDIDILPRVKTDSPAVSDYFLSPNGIVAKYAAMGIGGMRL
ncbi:MAG: alpha-amylase family glycosyl hydrolase, partial [Clostridia bacterium]|nr:alpha-amylase family glycosyl hydrolase [Clostridia bacterium]